MQQDRVSTLEALIRRYQDSYYSGEAEISDGEFDRLWDELKALAPDSPLLARVGSDAAAEDGFPKVRHIIPMGSQDKAANPQEFLAWAAKRPLSSYVVQYKLDGASLELQYEKGLLARALTRGDGVIGDEITANARKMNGVLERLDVDFSGGVRGEVLMAREVWQARYKEKANCRNAANGLMRRKDGEGCEDLTLVVYDATAVLEDGTWDGGFFRNETGKIAWLKERGFNVTRTRICKGAQAVIDYREKVSAERAALPFDIDGLVVKDNETDLEDLRRVRPEKQIAFKFALERAVSTLIAVEWSRSGPNYTPIGVVNPVRLAGTTVQRANLNNPGVIREMGLYIDAPVEVVKRGEIIPKIERLAQDVLPPVRQEPIAVPTACEICHTPLVDIGTRLYCPNNGCLSRVEHRLAKWVQVMDIREVGDKLIAQLFEKGRITCVADLYTLETEELAAYERMGETIAKKVVRNIRAKRTVSLAAFIAGFDIEGIAELTMEKVVAAGFDTLEKLRGAEQKSLAAVFGLGEVTSRQLRAGLEETAADMDAVLKTGCVSISPPGGALALAGKSFCFTGELRGMKRAEAEALVKARGASAKAGVTRDLSYLVTNTPESNSGKNKKARELGIAVIDEEQFLKIVGKGENARAVKACGAS